MAEEKKLQVFPVGITEKEIKKIADQAIADSGAANEVPLATVADAGKILKVSGAGAYELAEESTGTNVVANPVLAGTEADLTGLQVGDTKYKIAAGGSGGSSSDLTVPRTQHYITDDEATVGDVLTAFGLQDGFEYGSYFGVVNFADTGLNYYSCCISKATPPYPGAGDAYNIFLYEMFPNGGSHYQVYTFGSTSGFETFKNKTMNSITPSITVKVPASPYDADNPDTVYILTATGDSTSLEWVDKTLL